MEHTTSLRDKSENWWWSLHIHETRDLRKKYKIEVATPEIIEAIYLKEHPIELEVGKEKDSLDKAAERYIMGEGGETQRMYGHHYRSFRAGSEWQKETDKALITDLFKALEEIKECFDGNGTINTFWLLDHVTKAITKAEKHLNNQ